MAELRGGSTVGGLPIETTKGSQEKIELHAKNTQIHITAAERSAWNAKAGTAVATTTANGLLSAADKLKLDGIASNANNYSLPAASSSVLGGVKTSTNITNSSGTISVADASTTVKGVVKLNNTLTSTATLEALTAGQGKVLNDKIVAIESTTIKIDKGGDGKRYIKIAEMPTPSTIGTDSSNLTLLINGIGDFGNGRPGSIIAFLSNRNSIKGNVFVINDNGITSCPLGYVNNTSTGKVDVYFIDPSRYNHALDIKVLANETNYPVKMFSIVGTAPAGLTLYPSFKYYETTSGAQEKVNLHANNETVHITATERSTWNAKAGTSVASATANGLMSAADKHKLDRVGVKDGTIHIGANNDISATTSFVFGDDNIVGGTNNSVRGYRNIIYGDTSFAEGVGNIIFPGTIVDVFGVNEATGVLTLGNNNAFIKVGDEVIMEMVNTDRFSDVRTYRLATITSVINNNSIKLNYTEPTTKKIYLTKGMFSITTGAHVEGYHTKSRTGFGPHAEGYNTEAVGSGAHAEGSFTEAIGEGTHAEGLNTSATADGAHSEGFASKANGRASHAEGSNTTANGEASHAAGVGSESTGFASRASGVYTVTGPYASTAIGVRNKGMTGSGTVFATTSDAFVIGNGASATSKSNAFRVMYSGATYGQGAYNSTGADYAEFFEWLDGNPENEDRVGYAVTLDGEYIRLTNAGEEILGIISVNPSVVGDSHQDDWNGRYVTDIWGRRVTEEFEYTQPMFDEEEGKVIEKTMTGIRFKENPEWVGEEEYIPREHRKEWDTVGLMGKLMSRTDGTLQVNNYAKVGDGGLLTHSEEPTNIRVMAVMGDNVAKVFIK